MGTFRLREAARRALLQAQADLVHEARALSPRTAPQGPVQASAARSLLRPDLGKQQMGQRQVGNRPYAPKVKKYRPGDHVQFFEDQESVSDHRLCGPVVPDKIPTQPCQHVNNEPLEVLGITVAYWCPDCQQSQDSEWTVWPSQELQRANQYCWCGKKGSCFEHWIKNHVPTGREYGSPTRPYEVFVTVVVFIAVVAILILIIESVYLE